MFAIIHIATSYLLPLNAPSVYREACRACLMGFSKVFDVCARHCNTLEMGHWYDDVLQSVIVVHRIQCKFLILCLELSCVGALQKERKYLPFSMVLG